MKMVTERVEAVRLRRNEVEGEGIPARGSKRGGGRSFRLVTTFERVLLFPTLRGERESSTTCPTMRTAATPGGGP